ncbi:MAG: PaeR7I family type II restriction endonuclease [Bacteroides sp.]|nr:PaeR7I family type II restriction endonuclease [Bacteroides sp.]
MITEENIIVVDSDYTSLIAQAIKTFWSTKKKQLTASGDTTNRGAVVGGKQMDKFINLLQKVATDAGVPANCIITGKNYLPGYFRSSKDWDMLVIAPSGKLIAAIELKSQVGSYGNNFNNREEEAIGSAVDLWTAFREGQFPNQQAPWIGWLMVVGHDKASKRVVRNYEPHFQVRPEFNGASYIDRYRILCQKLILERHYTSTALLWTSDETNYGDVSSDISIYCFLTSFAGYLNGMANEFK